MGGYAGMAGGVMGGMSGGGKKLEKGEEVLTAKEAREYRRTMEKSAHKGKRISVAAKTGRHSRKTGRGKAKGTAKRIISK